MRAINVSDMARWAVATDDVLLDHQRPKFLSSTTFGGQPTMLILEAVGSYLRQDASRIFIFNDSSTDDTFYVRADGKIEARVHLYVDGAVSHSIAEEAFVFYEKHEVTAYTVYAQNAEGKIYSMSDTDRDVLLKFSKEMQTEAGHSVLKWSETQLFV